MQTSLKRFFFWVAACVLLIVFGCSSGDPRVAPVVGTVTLDGSPVKDASVAFQPAGGGRPAVGRTNSDGTFALTTFKALDGAIIGDHVVTITAYEESRVDSQSVDDEFGSLDASMKQTPIVQVKRKWLVPEAYSKAQTSSLTYSVKRGKNQADFALQQP